MQILGLLGMYIDAVVVEVMIFFYFYSDLLWPYCGMLLQTFQNNGKSNEKFIHNQASSFRNSLMGYLIGPSSHDHALAKPHA